MGNRFEETVQQGQSQPAPEGTEDATQAALGENADETKRLNVRVPKPLYERFKAKAESEGRSMTWLILRYIREYVSEQAGPQN